MIRWPIRWIRGPLQLAIQAAGGMLRWVRINKVERIEYSRLEPSQCDKSSLLPSAKTSDGAWICKQRTWYCHLPIMVGNLVWRFRYPSLRVLPTNQWLAWEQAISEKRSETVVTNRRSQASHASQFTESNCRGLLVPAWPGEPLSRLLQRSDLNDWQKLKLIVAAAESLARLHQIQIEGETPLPIWLSHGDASVANVICHDDLFNQRHLKTNLSKLNQNCTHYIHRDAHQDVLPFQPVAIWFDFDLRHDLRVDSVVRQADDLRAFLFTMAWIYTDGELAEILAGVRQVYSRAAVWSRLAYQLRKSNLQTDLFHWAQLYRLETNRPRKTLDRVKNQQPSLPTCNQLNRSRKESVRRLSALLQQKAVTNSP